LEEKETEKEVKEKEDEKNKYKVNLITTNQLFKITIYFYKTDKFSIIAEKLYIKNPELKGKKLFF